MMSAPARFALMALLLLVAGACGLLGGTTNSIDVMLIRDGITARATSSLPTTIGWFLNTVGGVFATIGLRVIAALLLWRRGRSGDSLRLAGLILGGRLVVEATKQLVHRPRPALDPHPVTLHSLSFPSAHAANSMIVFCALVLVFAPRATRHLWIVAAVTASLLIGASRTLLGVHWPSDVVAGWAIGGAWLLLWSPMIDRLATNQAQHDVVGGHRPSLLQS